MPVIPGPTAAVPEALPIRNDPLGDGYFGAKRGGGKRKHLGIDLASPMAGLVYASKSGWARIFYYPHGYGKLVVINHPGNWQTRYGHLDNIKIKSYSWVKQGDVIGSVGKTGNAIEPGIMPHLHFEIRKNNKPLNPEPFLLKKRKECCE